MVGGSQETCNESSGANKSRTCCGLLVPRKKTSNDSRQLCIEWSWHSQPHPSSLHKLLISFLITSTQSHTPHQWTDPGPFYCSCMKGLWFTPPPSPTLPPASPLLSLGETLYSDSIDYLVSVSWMYLHYLEQLSNHEAITHFTSTNTTH